MNIKRFARTFAAMAFVAFCIASCRREELTGPELPVVLHGHQANAMDTEDSCDDGITNDCHWVPITYQSEDLYWNCPVGCYTYPVDPATRTKISSAMTRINTSLCPWARDYLNYLLFHNQVRLFDQNYGLWGDIHVHHDGTNNPDYGAKMHLYKTGTNNQTELAKTLLHEAWHGYFRSGDPIAAEREAQACVN